MSYRYTVPAKNGRMKYKVHIGKKDKISEWTVYSDRVSFVSNNKQTELDKKKDVIVEEIEE